MICSRCSGAMTLRQKFCASCGAPSGTMHKFDARGLLAKIKVKARSQAGAMSMASMSPERARLCVQAGAIVCALTAAIAVLGGLDVAQISQGRIMAALLFGGAAAGLWLRNSRIAAGAAGLGAVLLLIVASRLDHGAWTIAAMLILAVFAAAGLGAHSIAQRRE